MSAPLDLLGSLRLRPGVAPPEGILGGRADVSAALLRGQTPGAAIERVALLHTLCATAHRQVAQRAVMLAMSSQDAAPDAAPDAATIDRLAADIAREHARRIGHDWALAWGGVSQAGALSRLPRKADAHVLADWLASEWLGLPPSTWLQDMVGPDRTIDVGRDLPRLIAALQRSAQACPAGIAAPLVLAVQRCLALPFTPGPISAPLRLEDPAQARALGHAMTTPGYCRAPTWVDTVTDNAPTTVPDTGPWNRLERPPATTAPTVAVRLLSRWVELLRLALPLDAGGWRPAHGAVSLGEGHALTWVETSRGLLAHRVSLQGHGPDTRVSDWQVLAPTEWNFHPHGTLAHALAAWPADHPDTPEAVRLLACAYDPCMACEIEMTTVERTPHA
ncbi:nickel-dependent hydrogenase large subunit [Sphaerotilus mobilis]|uniref:Nickel-dependent hydrogenase n=1 Tax=Sphaerotilus mobilis TaxID=47994 RepID=A0A4Q7LSP9_9BURK|nr:nickel-dependent hydrogenase large subunit [Sphaerotilus mobilis]RZS57885.1 nickel-dependent hydrogenase [Sphaerotilus mobilis]